MDRLKNVIDRLPLDNKLVTAVPTTVIVAAALHALGVAPQAAIALAGLAGGGSGYATPNDGTVLRKAGGEDGNPSLPLEEWVPAEDVRPIEE